MRALDRHDGEQVHVRAHFGDLDGRGESGESATNDNDSGISCHVVSFHHRDTENSISCFEPPCPCDSVVNSFFISLCTNPSRLQRADMVAAAWSGTQSALPVRR